MHLRRFGKCIWDAAKAQIVAFIATASTIQKRQRKVGASFEIAGKSPNAVVRGVRERLEDL